MRRVVACQVRVGLRAAQIIDGDDREIVPLLGRPRAFVVGAQDIAADAAVTVDRDFDAHSLFSLIRLVIALIQAPASPRRQRARR